MAAEETPRARRKVKPVSDVHLDELLELVVEHNASDLHVTANLPPVLRIDGELKKTRY